MAFVLKVGSGVSNTLLVLGLMLVLATPWTAPGDRLLTAGLLILMATPVANLIVAIEDEIAAKEWTFVAIGAIVLLLLGGSLYLAFA
jgi:uncharacterized membrane protein